MREAGPPPPPSTREAAASSISSQRIAVITEMDRWSASTRYRALHHVPRLQRLFRSVEVSLPSDPTERAPGRVGQIRYFAGHAVRYVERASAVAAVARRSDALLIQRGLYVVGPAAIVQSLQGFSGRIVFDLDDAVFELSPSLARKGAAARWLYGPQQALHLMRRADAIVVSSQALADALPAGVPAPVLMPTVPDPARYPIAVHDETRPVVVGWAGTVGGIAYLDPLRPVFQRLTDEGIARFEVVSSQRWAGPASFRRWRLKEEVSIFDDFSIGIMPLPDCAYTRAKAGFKLLQYMAAGLPVVGSPVGVNRELIDQSGAGLLAESPSEWEEAIRTLAADAQLRRSMGARGRSFVERYADLDAQALTLARLLVGAPSPR